MKMQLMTKASRLVNTAGLEIKKHSPEILLVAGIVGTVASTVMACKATTKVSKIMEEKNEQVKIVHDVLETQPEQYSEEDSKRDLTIIYAQTGVKLVKNYAPAIILGGLSIASIVAGHTILKKRNVALAAAYAVVDTSFKKYRKNVVERFGSELDKELRYGIKAKEIEEVVVDEKGKEKIQKKTIQVTDNGLDDISDYARFYDDGNTGWQKDPELNLMFLRRQQEWANEKLKAQGYLFLNDVYEMLGIPRSKAGQSVGWIYRPNDENFEGDSYVDFGIYNVNREANRNFVNGYEPTILLDFNVDGNILNDPRFN
jgi:hypothetical protein